MKIAMLSPIDWRTSPRHYGTLESIVSLLTEGLVAAGMDVTLFATADSETSGRLVSISPKGYRQAPDAIPGVLECLHISELFEQAESFDLIHNHFGCLPLTYMGMSTTPVVTTIHGCLPSSVIPVYQKYNNQAFYVAASESDKNPKLSYISTIHNGIDLSLFTFCQEHGEYLLFLGPIHADSDAAECIDAARKAGMKIILAGEILDQVYFNKHIRPNLDNTSITYAGSASDHKKRYELLAGSYALFCPGSSDESVPLCVLEAMACGTPVIAEDCGRMQEAISNATTGFLVKKTDEIPDAISQIKQIKRSMCRRWVEERFSKDRMVQNYTTVYESILHKTKREDHRPWGFYEILSDTPLHKVKRITVYPGQRLSYQRHFHRSEHWYIINGIAVVTKNGEDIELSFGQAIDLPVHTWHRIRNPGSENMVFIEVQTGDYFGEDDIERSEDDYGRLQ